MNPSQAQYDFIKSLLRTRHLTQEILADVDDARARAMQDTFTRAEASALIDRMTALPPVSLEGMHQLPSGEIYKVQVAVHGSGREYAKRLTVSNGEAHFEMERGAMRLLSADTRMTAAAAAEFGSLYGICCNCGRTLTDEDSIARGIGPVCAEYFV